MTTPLTRRTFVISALGMGVAAQLGGCASDDAVAAPTLVPLGPEITLPRTGAKTIEIFTATYASDANTAAMVDGFARAARDAGYEPNLTDTAAGTADPAEQIAAAVRRRSPPDAIVIAGGEPAALDPAIAAAARASIPVIGLGMTTSDGLTVNVTSDDEFLGNASAAALAYVVGTGAAVGIISYDLLPPIRRRALAARALMRAQGITMVDDVQGDPFDATGAARRTTLAWLAKYKPGTIDGIFAAWDAAALGAYQATQETGRVDVYVVGVDGRDFARAAVREGGTWIATAGQDWALLGARALATLTEIFAGTAPATAEIRVPGELFTRENA